MSNEKYINNVAQTLIRIFLACYVFAFETKVFLVREGVLAESGTQNLL